MSLINSTPIYQCTLNTKQQLFLILFKCLRQQLEFQTPDVSSHWMHHSSFADVKWIIQIVLIKQNKIHHYWSMPSRMAEARCQQEDICLWLPELLWKKKKNGVTNSSFCFVYPSIYQRILSALVSTHFLVCSPKAKVKREWTNIFKVQRRLVPRSVIALRLHERKGSFKKYKAEKET